MLEALMNRIDASGWEKLEEIVTFSTADQAQELARFGLSLEPVRDELTLLRRVALILAFKVAGSWDARKSLPKLGRILGCDVRAVVVAHAKRSKEAGGAAGPPGTADRREPNVAGEIPTASLPR